jgi:tetratricopeptide (TPR) repeat protein
MSDPIINGAQLAQLIDVGLAAAHLGKPGEARAIFENLLVYQPEHAPARIGLAFTHLVCNDFATAEFHLRKTLAQNPGDAEALALLGLTLGFGGKPEEAAKTLERVPAGSPTSRFVELLSEFKA